MQKQEGKRWKQYYPQPFSSQ